MSEPLIQTIDATKIYPASLAGFFGPKLPGT